MRKRRDIMQDARDLHPLLLILLEVLLDIRDQLARRDG
jgi:hypothetical protein